MQNPHDEIGIQQDQLEDWEDASDERQSILQHREADFHRRWQALRYREERHNRNRNVLARREIQVEARLHDQAGADDGLKRNFAARGRTAPSSDRDYDYCESCPTARRMLQPVTRRQRDHSGIGASVFDEAIGRHDSTPEDWDETSDEEEDLENDEELSPPRKRRHRDRTFLPEGMDFSPAPSYMSHRHDPPRYRPGDRLSPRQTRVSRANYWPDPRLQAQRGVRSYATVHQPVRRYADDRENYTFRPPGAGYQYGRQGSDLRSNYSPHSLQDYRESSYGGPAGESGSFLEYRSSIEGRGLSFPRDFEPGLSPDGHTERSRHTNNSFRHQDFRHVDDRSLYSGSSHHDSHEDHDRELVQNGAGSLRNYKTSIHKDRDRSFAQWPNNLDYGSGSSPKSAHSTNPRQNRGLPPTQYNLLMQHLNGGDNGRGFPPTEYNLLVQALNASGDDTKSSITRARTSEWAADQRRNSIPGHVAAGLHRQSSRDETPMHGFGASDDNMDVENAEQFERRALRRETWTREHDSDPA